jgi:predicted nucleic acid-binding protein
MADDLVVDCSVVAKLYFAEDNSDFAIAVLRHAEHLIAPDLLFADVASVAAKQVRRGGIPAESASRALETVHELVDERAPLDGLARRAFHLAHAHGLSAYDGIYLAAAEERGPRVVTADEKLVRKAVEAGLGHLVQSLTRVR